ncbi:hypothetical protein C8J57DRAFT_1524992 [Mycena rebaudengoi]|nr:hypothetical protein C8J57DRAFT_1524992 [Mycena rebaudengoi]
MAPNHKRSTSFALHDLCIQALVRYSCKLRKRTLRSLHSISVFHTLLYDQNCALGTNCNTPAMFVFSCPSTQPHLRAFSAALSGKPPVANVNRVPHAPDISTGPAPYGFYYGANDFIPGEFPHVPSALPRSPYHLLQISDAFLRAIFAILTRAATPAPPKRSADLIFRLSDLPNGVYLLLYPFTPYSYPDHPLQTPLHRPLLRTRKSYNDGLGLAPHRLHGDAALKSVVATGLYLLESPRAADLKRARLLTDPWGARARAGCGTATPYMSVDVEKVTSGFRTLQELWAAVLTITVACTMLWHKHKGGIYVMCAPLIFIAALIGCTSSISRFVGAAQKAWHKTTDVRIKLLVRQRAGLGGLYLYRLFTIVNLLNGPLNSIGQQLPSLFASFASLGRIQGFLQLPEKAEAESDGATRDVADLVDVSIDGNGVKESTVEVSLKECTFAWEDKTKSHKILKDITLKLAPRELGRSPGKSSLLMSILEETTLVTDTVKVKAHKIALASQTPFICPGTLRANILLDGAYDESFYNRVIHACDLRQEIETLPRRDIPSSGIRVWEYTD